MDIFGLGSFVIPLGIGVTLFEALVVIAVDRKASLRILSPNYFCYRVYIVLGRLEGIDKFITT
jgi:hypothetical protein